MIVSLEPVSDRHLDALTTVLDTGVINDVDKEFLRKKSFHLYRRGVPERTPGFSGY